MANGGALLRCQQGRLCPRCGASDECGDKQKRESCMAETPPLPVLQNVRVQPPCELSARGCVHAGTRGWRQGEVFIRCDQDLA